MCRPSEALPAGAMDTARTIVENRVNALGVTEPVVQRQGERRIIVELPGIKNPDEAIATLRETGLLEFIDAGTTTIYRKALRCGRPSARPSRLPARRL